MLIISSLRSLQLGGSPALFRRRFTGLDVAFTNFGS